MKIKEYLSSLPYNSNLGGKGLLGKELKILEPHFDTIEELKGKKIKIIEELKTVGEPSITMTKKGVIFKLETEPKLINIKDIEKLGDKIELYSIFLNNDVIVFRCTENSLYST